MEKALNTRAEDVLPNIHRTQAAVSVYCRHPRLRRNGVVCCCVQRTAYALSMGWLSSFSFWPWWPWPLTFKLVRARVQHVFPVNLAQIRSKGIWVKSKNVPQSALKTERYLRAVMYKKNSLDYFTRYVVSHYIIHVTYFSVMQTAQQAPTSLHISCQISRQHTPGCHQWRELQKQVIKYSALHSASFGLQQQSFYGPLSGTNRVSRYQKKHSPTHQPSWSSSNLYQFLPSNTIHSILLVQTACLAIFLHNLSTPFWSTSWSGALHLIFHTVLVYCHSYPQLTSLSVTSSLLQEVPITIYHT